MVILFVHNYYQQAGGEDAGVRQERDLLAAAGHKIIEYSRHSNEITLDGYRSRLRLAAEAQWSRRTLSELRRLLGREKPNVAYIHNTVPLVSPSAYYACSEASVPVIQTLHNYRLLCPAHSFLRQGHVCEECVDHTLFRSIWYRCYQDSAGASAALALMIATQRLMGTWKEKVSCFIVRTEFAKAKFIQGGFPSERIVVKPCFVHPDPGPRSGAGDSAVFVGRLSAEKGLRTLFAAWGKLSRKIPLRIVGTGPLWDELHTRARNMIGHNIEMLGSLSNVDTLAEIKRSRFLVFPSEWYEGLPLTIAEAFACGVPVIASRIGSMINLIKDGHTGLHFTPGDALDLAAKVEWAWAHPSEIERMGCNARAEYEANYTAERNYEILSDINRRVTGKPCPRLSSAC